MLKDLALVKAATTEELWWSIGKIWLKSHIVKALPFCNTLLLVVKSQSVVKNILSLYDNRSASSQTIILGGLKTSLLSVITVVAPLLIITALAVTLFSVNDRRNSTSVAYY